MTIKQLLDKGTAELEKFQTEDAAFDARELLLEAASLTETQFLLSMNKSADAVLTDQYMSLLRRRAFGEPLQYIIGKWDFLGNEFFVGKGVLIPRPETEQLAELCMERIREGGIKTVYDLCAGSGCIGISIAKAFPQTEVYLFEKYDAALGYCKKNAEYNGVNNVKVIACDIFDGAPDGLPAAQLIVSNPPYVPAREIPGLQRELYFEPVTALDGGKDGMDFYRAIAEKWMPVFGLPEFAAFECGEGQPEIVARMFSEFGNIVTVTDVFGVQRFVCCKKIK